MWPAISCVAAPADGRVNEAQASDAELAQHMAAERAGAFAVVVAGDPDPFASLLHDAQRLAVVRVHAFERVAIVEAVAERDDGRGVVGVDDLGEALQGFARVVGRQHLALGGEMRAFFQMQVGDDEGVLGRPIEGAGHVGAESLAADARCWSAKSASRGAPVSIP